MHILIAIGFIVIFISAYVSALNKEQQANSDSESIAKELTDNALNRLEHAEKTMKENQIVSPNDNPLNYPSAVTTTTLSQNTATHNEQTHQKYDVIIKNTPFNDNMNYNFYSFKAKYSKTNKFRNRKIEAFSEEDAKQRIISEGYLPPIELEQIPFPGPTPNQIEACESHGNPIPTNACQYDVSAIISKEMDRDSIPNPDLVTYATNKKIMFSYYIGKKALYNLIFFKLDDEDRIAFFIFAIYRYNSNNRNANLDTSPHKDIFYEFAKSKLNDERFYRSMNKYQGEDLRYFGNITFGGYQYQGGSKNTIAYKAALDFLIEKNLL